METKFIELSHTEKLRIEIEITQLEEKAVAQAIQKDCEHKTPADFNKLVTDCLIELFKGYAGNLHHTIKSNNEDINNLKRQIK